MGFLCTNRQNSKNVSQKDLANEKFLRDNGLSNVYNVNPDLNFCLEDFYGPQYYVDGATKLVSGLTASLSACTTGNTGIVGVYNLTNTPNITLNFVITGGTDFLNYDGGFCYQIYPKERFNVDITTNSLIAPYINECVSFSAISNSYPSYVTKEIIPTGFNTNWTTFNPINNTVYVSNKGSQSIDVIDVNTYDIINTITYSGWSPTTSAIDTFNNKLFVCNDTPFQKEITIVDCNTNTIVTTLTAGTFNQNIFYTPNVDGYMFVTDSAGSKIYKINTLNNTITTITGFTNYTYGITYDLSANTVYTTSLLGNKLYSINATTNVVNYELNVGSSPSSVAINSSNQTLYITNSGTTNITVVSATTSPLSGFVKTNITTDQNPTEIIGHPLSNSMYYVCNKQITGTTYPTVFRIDCTDNTIKESIPLPSGIDGRSGGFSYVSSKNSIYLTNSYLDPLGPLVDRVHVITPSTITKELLEGSLPNSWGEYLIRTNYNFSSKTCSPGTIYNTSNTPQTNAYQESDYYFMTVTNPSIPIIEGPSAIGNDSYVLITDRLYVKGRTGPQSPQAINNERNYFYLTAVPLNGQIILTVNGVQLTQSFDPITGSYITPTPPINTDNGDFRIIYFPNSKPPVVEIYGQIEDDDIVIANYITGGGTLDINYFDTYTINTIIIDGIVTGTSANASYRTFSDNTIFYNTEHNSYEFFTTEAINTAFSTIVSVNGTKLTKDLDYYISNTFNGRIIFNNNIALAIDDVVSVLFAYSQAGINSPNYGSLSTNQFTLTWTVPTAFTNPEVVGRFIVQLFDNVTGNLLSQQTPIDFAPGQSQYSSLFTSLPLDTELRFKVTFETKYIGYLNNEVITCSFAEAYANTTSEYINNVY
jgi:DNA-binding beta-propeller fold protein YncE